MFHDDEHRPDCNPVVLHALYLLDDCHDQVEEALALTRLQIRPPGMPAVHSVKHWLHVHAVLNRELKGKC
jgi:hypothetical protein